MRQGVQEMGGDCLKLNKTGAYPEEVPAARMKRGLFLEVCEYT